MVSVNELTIHINHNYLKIPTLKYAIIISEIKPAILYLNTI